MSPRFFYILERLTSFHSAGIYLLFFI